MSKNEAFKAFLGKFDDVPISCDTVVVRFVPTAKMLEMLNQRYFRYRSIQFQGAEDLQGLEVYTIDMNEFRMVDVPNKWEKLRNGLMTDGQLMWRMDDETRVVNRGTGEVKTVATTYDAMREKRMYQVPASWSYDCIVEHRSDVDCRLTMSIPKFFYGHNVLEWPACRPMEFMEKLDSFYKYFFQNFFGENFYNCEPVYLRIDFGKNYHFSEYERMQLWYQNAMQKMSYVANQLYKNDAETRTGTIEFKGEGWYCKIYDKGLDFEKHGDLTRLRNAYGYKDRPHSERRLIDDRLEYLRSFAKNCVRIEFEVRAQAINDIYLRTIDFQPVDKEFKKKVKQCFRVYGLVNNFIQGFRGLYKLYSYDEQHKESLKFCKKYLEFIINPVSLGLLRKSSLIRSFSRLSYNQYYGVNLPTIENGWFVDLDFGEKFADVFYVTHKKMSGMPVSWLVEYFFQPDIQDTFDEYKKIVRVRPCVPAVCKGFARRVFLYSGKVIQRQSITMNYYMIYEVYRRMYRLLTDCVVRENDFNMQTTLSVLNVEIKHYLKLKGVNIQSTDKYIRHLQKKCTDPFYANKKKNRKTYYRLEKEMALVYEYLDLRSTNNLENFDIWQRINHNRLKLTR